ncbi:uncharacterized mitochondrial protein AtMg00810-like [Rutidosis leptorrhynchoides]|uniref:uncharacterized mitochondrial protein AtMg00810-like n=1 Tax=Rutidosis leptorrhynchoides TaxID=125765 RepID=UPI003A9A00BD
MTGCKPVSTHVEQNLSVACEPSVNEKLVANITEYQKLVRRLIYITLSKPDISFVVHVLSQYMHSPLQSHSDLAFRVLSYLKGADGKGIQFVKDNGFSLNAYCDSDWGDKNKEKNSEGCLMLAIAVELLVSIAWLCPLLLEPPLAKFRSRSEFRLVGFISRSSTSISWVGLGPMDYCLLSIVRNDEFVA